MVKKNYQAENYDNKNSAKAILKSKPVSLKYSTEMANYIKNKPVSKAQKLLENIKEKKDFLPLKKYVKKIGHRKGAKARTGKYPQKVCDAFLELINNVKANASNKGLDENKLLITHVFASQGYQRVSYQSHGKIGGKRRKSKSTHIEMIALEAKSL